MGVQIPRRVHSQMSQKDPVCRIETAFRGGVPKVGPAKGLQDRGGRQHFWARGYFVSTSGTRHRGHTGVHQEAGRGGQAPGATESVAVTAAFRRLTAIGAASATPPAALSGSHPKAPGFAGGYLLANLIWSAFVGAF